MKTVLWVDLVGENVSETMAVVSGPSTASPERKPMIRRLKCVEWERIGGYRWLYLRWHSENPNPEGRYDCGYSGMREDLVLSDKPTIEVSDD